MEIEERAISLQRVLPPGMQPADGKAGIGISFAPDMEGYQIIQSMAPQGTAASSGEILAGDIIISVDGKPVRHRSIREVVESIKGEPDSSVNLVMGRRIEQKAEPEQEPEPVPEPPERAQAPAPVPPAPTPPQALQTPPAPVAPPAPSPPISQKPLSSEAKTSSPSHAEPGASSLPLQPTPESKQNGFVIKNWPDGKQYRGEMLDGKRHGKGSITYPDGASYDGDWHNDWRHGHGEYKYTDGTWYKGQWEMGNRQGEGLCTYADGNMFQGSWVANLPHGKGQCRFAEGSLYRGEFVMGKMHGFGTLIRHDGTIAFEGEWRDGEKVAPVVSQAPVTAPQPEMTRQAMHSVVAQRAAAAPQPAADAKIFVMIKGVSHLPRMVQGAPNPYVVLAHGAQSHVSRTLHQTYEPRWDAEIGEFTVRAANDLDPFIIRVFHWNPNHSDLVGEVEIDVRDPSRFASQQELTFKLTLPDGSMVWGHDGQKTELYAAVALSPPVYHPPPTPVTSSPQPARTYHAAGSPPSALQPVTDNQPIVTYQAVSPPAANMAYAPPQEQMQRMSMSAQRTAAPPPPEPHGQQQAHPQFHRPSPTPPLQRSMNPQQYAQSDSMQSMQPSLSRSVSGSVRCGVGLKLVQPDRSGNVSIEKIQKDSAADVSGRLKVGDIVLKVDGQKITAMEQAKDLLIGQEGSAVALEIARSDGGIRIFEVVLSRKNLSIRRGPGAGGAQDYHANHSYHRASHQGHGPNQSYGTGGGTSASFHNSYDPWGQTNSASSNVSRPHARKCRAICP